MAFDLKNYETVKQRKKRFYETNPDGRIVVNSERLTENEAVFFVQIFKNKEDQKDNLAWATGYAQEFKGVGGMANKTSWCENCEESAVGRALDNAGYANHSGPSLEEMQKVERAERTATKTHPAAYTAPADEVPEDYQIPFGADMGKRLSGFDKQNLEEKLKKLREYISKNPKAPETYRECAAAIELVLGGPIKF